MGGFFGAVSKRDITFDLFFGVDYHSHLGARRAGMVVRDEKDGYQKQIHDVESTPFRAKFEKDLLSFHGSSGIGCISDRDPQPLLVRSHLGFYAVSAVGVVNNAPELIEKYFFSRNRQFMATSSGNINSVELIAALINQKDSFAEGLRYAQEIIDGSATVLILSGSDIIAARDKLGRLPVLIGKNGEGYCVSFESFAYRKLGYADERELGPGEIVRIGAEGWETLSAPRDKMRICAFLWTYYGYPNSNYEGKNVELARYRNGSALAKFEEDAGSPPEVDYVAGVPDSGIPHAIGYANYRRLPLARPFVKYTPTWPRSFMSPSPNVRRRVAKMKQIPVPELIEGKRLLFVDDSIVRGTQLQQTVKFLYDSGAREVHMRSACPPIMYGCRFLNFSGDNSDSELLTRRVIFELEGAEGEKRLNEYADCNTERGKRLRNFISKKMGFCSLVYQTLGNLLEAIGVDKDKICTYCWTGKD